MLKRAILCVDDEKIILDSLKTQLRQEFGDAFMYETAENASDAEEIIEEIIENGTTMIVIVSDWLMPGVKGDELLIKIHARYPDIVKILLSGQASEEAIQRAYDEANLHKCLSKPWDEQELIQTIKSGLDLLQNN